MALRTELHARADAAGAVEDLHELTTCPEGDIHRAWERLARRCERMARNSTDSAVIFDMALRDAPPEVVSLHQVLEAHLTVTEAGYRFEGARGGERSVKNWRRERDDAQ